MLGSTRIYLPTYFHASNAAHHFLIETGKCQTQWELLCSLPPSFDAGTRQLKTDGNHVCGGCTELPTKEVQYGTIKLSFLITNHHRSPPFCDNSILRSPILMTNTCGCSYIILSKRATSKVGVAAMTPHSNMQPWLCPCQLLHTPFY